MSLSKSYEVKEIEKKWISQWKDEKIYEFKLKSENYSVDTPPPFTSGTLHMGHILDFTWIDLVARYERMMGKNVYLPQGFDCHGLPTEMRVEREYKISPRDKKKFLEKCIEWTDLAVNKMIGQFDSIGYSTDWKYQYRTMDNDYKSLVQRSLLEFYNKGLLYRGRHPVLFCTNCQTALAKAEVGYTEKTGKLYFIDLPVGESKITIATTRPEMMPACVAVFVHPDDKRYETFVGKKVQLPFGDREVPIIADRDVDMSFGSGVVYLCTFGDEQDIAWQKRYKLPIIEVITSDGKMKNSGELNGLIPVDARKKILEILESKGLVIDIKDYPHRVLSHTERGSCMSPIELLPVEQWFINVKKFTKEISRDGKKIKWNPDKEYIRLKDWSDSLDWDWIISRQRTFGTPIPFWYCSDCGELIPAKVKSLPVNPALDESPVKKCPKCKSSKIIGEEDVCDCWVDSSVTPLKISKFWEDNSFFKKTYPTNLRPQGYEIIRTWLFYTLFRCKQLTNQIPWSEAMIHGMVAGTDGRKMSKSFGNIVDPDNVLKDYGADVLRQWAATPVGSDDFPFSWDALKHGNSFLTKLWNVCRFIENFGSSDEPKKLLDSDNWILFKFNEVKKNYFDAMKKREFGNVLRDVRNFLWHSFADYYIEMVKHRLYNENIYGKDSRDAALFTLRNILKESLLLLAPFTPFITEELWRNLFNSKESIHLQSLPGFEKKFLKKDYLDKGEELVALLNKVREEKRSKNLSLGAELESFELESKFDFDLKELSGMLRIKNLTLKK